MSRYGMSDRMVTDETAFVREPNYSYEEGKKKLVEDREFAGNYLRRALGKNAGKGRRSRSSQL
jgi:hypothetical protein